MVKILAQAGNSLADIYDVEGSIAGIDQLETRELPIVHEMGATVFSERMSGNTRRETTGALAQNTNFDILSIDFSSSMTRITGIAVIADTVSRVSFACVSMRNSAQNREVPIWFWDAGVDVDANVRIANGGAAANVRYLLGVSPIPGLPCTLMGADQLQQFDEVAFRGRTAGFGAGEVTVQMILATAFASEAALSVRGLPIPSW